MIFSIAHSIEDLHIIWNRERTINRVILQNYLPPDGIHSKSRVERVNSFWWWELVDDIDPGIFPRVGVQCLNKVSYKLKIDI